MEGKLRNMTSVYISKAGKMLLLFRQGGRVVNDVWTGSAGGHFEECELNDARACVLREMEEELGLKESDVKNLAMRYIALRRTKGEVRQNYYFSRSYGMRRTRIPCPMKESPDGLRIPSFRLWKCRIPLNL